MRPHIAVDAGAENLVITRRVFDNCYMHGAPFRARHFASLNE